ncbi:hypothetical protein L3Y34_009523 [Caenorhabditis briggsae]|uniref:Uncharacterized protein n=1 Tax=Caenorhabditis briggsae TaxID=6238 RepID=A0AAE9A4D2_CAEBR|nr:hypothetical protein L3Y34_009523 [Caenorhabditis briggsae]
MILVVDVFNQKMTSLLIATCILFTSVSGQAPPPPYTVSPWSLAGPISSLHGTYQMRKTSISEHPPSLASVWQLGAADFNIVIWPPKHCQAVQVFFINKKHLGIGKFHIETDMVKNASLTFYPPIQTLEVITGRGGSPQKYFNQRSSIPFVHQDASKFKLEVTSSEVRKVNDYNAATANRMTEIEFDLLNKVALMVTNSRFCFAHITKDGSESSYDALFDPQVYDKSSDQLPHVLTISNKKTSNGYVSSLFNPLQSSWTTVNGQVRKTIDLLPVLQKPEFHDKNTMRQKSHCNGFVSTSRNPLKRALGAITVDSWEVNEINANLNQIDYIDDHFIVSIGQTCSWIRLWITDKDNTMEKYGNMKLDETIDIFFNQQFFVGPDSDEARPLSGNSTQIDRIAIRRHWDRQQSHGVAQMSYGRDGGQNFPYIEYFKMPSLSKPNIRINLIKAHSCQANIITSPQTRLSSANKPTPNFFDFVSCERFLLKNKNKHDKSNE